MTAPRDALRDLVATPPRAPRAEEIIEAITLQCRRGIEHEERGDHRRAARLIDSALHHMRHVDCPVDLRTHALVLRGSIALRALDHDGVIAALRTLAALARSEAPARSPILLLLEDVVAFDGEAPARFATGTVDVLLDVHGLFASALERARADLALDQALRRAIGDLQGTEPGVDDLARFSTWATRVCDLVDGAASKLRESAALLLVWVVGLAATSDSELLGPALRSLDAWCAEHDLWTTGDLLHGVPSALKLAVERLGNRTVDAKSEGRDAEAATAWSETCACVALIERRYGALAADDRRIAELVAEAASSALGADAFLGQRQAAWSRVSRIDALRELHPENEVLHAAWIRAPRRYVIALLRSGAAKDAITREILLARARAQQHLAAPAYEAWREEMRQLVDVGFLDGIGF